MIAVRGWFYDVTANQFISDEAIDCTIACMRNYSYNPIDNLNPYNMAWAANYINTTTAGQINGTFIYDTGGLIVTGALSPDTFEWDEMNLLLWIYAYFDALQRRYGSSANHVIRFVRDNNNVNDNYIEYNVNVSASDLFVLYNGNGVKLTNAAVRINPTDRPILYSYASILSDMEPITGSDIYYVGSFISNDLHPLGYFNNIYKSVERAIYTNAPTINAVHDSNNPFLFIVQRYTGGSYYANYCNVAYNEAQYIFNGHYNTSHAGSDWYDVPVFIISLTPFNTADYKLIIPAGTYNFVQYIDPDYPDLFVAYEFQSFKRQNNDSFTYENLLYPPIVDIGTLNWNTKTKDAFDYLVNYYGLSISESTRPEFYGVLTHIPPAYVEPEPSDVDPENIPPADEPPVPIVPDTQDPYYDPESDPKSPSYNPVKDPKNPSYNPAIPSTPYKPQSQPTILEMPVVQPTPTIIPTPETPPSYVTTNDLFTLFNPSGGDLTSIANFLWSPAWSVDTFKKIFANPLDCILGLLVLPHLQAPVDTKTMNIGNISTGITLHYFTSQFFDFDCGAFALPEYYQSYLDYAPYTKISIFLPYIGDQELNTDEVMGKNIGVKYRFDLATGDCIAFISIDGDVLYSFAGNCAARLPLSANNYAGIIPSITSAAIRASTIPSDVSAIGAATALAVTAMKQSASHTGSISGSAGLMGIQTPYLIVTRPRQALPLSQNSFKGYPSFITESLSQLSGYTEVDQVHLEHVPATGAELVEIERLLKEGVLF